MQRLFELLPAARPRFEARLSEFLSPQQLARVSAALSRSLDE